MANQITDDEPTPHWDHGTYPPRPVDDEAGRLQRQIAKLEAVVAAQSRVIVLAGDVRNRYQWEPEDWSRFDDALEKLEREQGGEKT